MRLLMVLVVVVIAVLAAWRFAKAGPAPQVGTMAPDFTLSSQEGKQLSLQDYRGKWVVLYFYPKDMTPGCTVEAHNFQRDQDQFAARNAVVLGVSVDSVDSHKKFCSKEGLNFKLLADTTHNVTREYGSLINLGVAQIAARHTFLIDPQGKIKRVYTQVDPRKHSEEIRSALDALTNGAGNRS